MRTVRTPPPHVPYGTRRKIELPAARRRRSSAVTAGPATGRKVTCRDCVNAQNSTPDRAGRFTAPGVYYLYLGVSESKLYTYLYSNAVADRFASGSTPLIAFVASAPPDFGTRPSEIVENVSRVNVNDARSSLLARSSVPCPLPVSREHRAKKNSEPPRR